MEIPRVSSNDALVRSQHPVADLLRKLLSLAAAKDMLAGRFNELLAANNATEKALGIALQELREARATIEAQGKMLVTLQERARSAQQKPDSYSLYR